MLSWHLPKLSKAEGKFESFFQIIDTSLSEIIFVVTLIACVRFGTVENVEAFHKTADHISRNSLDIFLQCTGRLAQELWRMAHGAKVGAQQRSSACEDSEKSRRSSDARQYRYWAPVLEKFVKGTAAGHHPKWHTLPYHSPFSISQQIVQDFFTQVHSSSDKSSKYPQTKV